MSADDEPGDEITVVGRYGTAILSARAPTGVRERVLAALGGPDDRGARADAADEQPPKRPDGTGLVKTGVWVDPDYVALPETGAWGEDAEETVVDPRPPLAVLSHPEPAPGSGRRRRRGSAPAPSAEATNPAPPPPPTPAAEAGVGADTDQEATGTDGDAVAATQASASATEALAEATAPIQSEAPVPLIPAAICAAGHPNPPDAVACQACVAPLTGEIRQVPRPVLAVLTVSTGQAVPVRGDVVVGRAPQARPGTETTAELVAVPSPTHFISRSHLEISVAGWNLLARDLGSANGTVLVRPQTPPVLLASALPTPLLVGDLLDVGDGVTLRVDPAL
ncbi:FHA domain-containing protein [Actinomyces sp.]|uniref:FHA domain-containing protein n=1 Tax=Actinomyces sp. TaxID=29317 RepID=UPI0026DD25A0|nr:FHA domain-containing protein [Actinomyces sp.]MDO4900148.1 FHA domain-containing protein [Actinomyces sp.]